MLDGNIIEKANKALTIANWVIWFVCLILFLKCGDWFGGRWYHWIFAFVLTGILKQFLGVVAKECVKVSFGLTEPGNNDGKDSTPQA